MSQNVLSVTSHDIHKMIEDTGFRKEEVDLSQKLLLGKEILENYGNNFLYLFPCRAVCIGEEIGLMRESKEK